ncbi:MAG: DUF3570 domain-containing protein [Myxococcales bacterium]|nr:MAG: DUF3570 domain-containing protein [Myxococcales bacterium]
MLAPGRGRRAGRRQEPGAGGRVPRRRPDLRPGRQRAAGRGQPRRAAARRLPPPRPGLRRPRSRRLAPGHRHERAPARGEPPRHLPERGLRRRAGRGLRGARAVSDRRAPTLAARPARLAPAGGAPALALLLAASLARGDGAVTPTATPVPGAVARAAGSDVAVRPATTLAPRPHGSDLTVRVATETSAYTDSDHVAVLSPTVALAIDDPVRGWNASGRYLVDVVSAASADIVATASRRWREVRHVGSLDASYKPRDLGFGLRASVSREPDYLSLGAGVLLTADFLDKTRTVTLGYGLGHDTSGRSGTSFDVFARTLVRHGLNASASAVIDRATRVTVVADAILERGDPSKPYRYVPVFAPGTADRLPSGSSLDVVNALRADERPLERLPLARDRFALSARLARRFSGWTLRVDERGYLDTWGVRAATTDVRLLFDLGRRGTFGPHLRVHVQGGASFWRRVYEAGTDASGRRVLPRWITGDRELGPMQAYTLGGSFGWALGPAEDLSRRRLGLSFDGVSSVYTDSLLLARRNGVFSALTFEAAFD